MYSMSIHVAISLIMSSRVCVWWQGLYIFIDPSVDSMTLSCSLIMASSPKLREGKAIRYPAWAKEWIDEVTHACWIDVPEYLFGLEFSFFGVCVCVNYFWWSVTFGSKFAFLAVY